MKKTIPINPVVAQNSARISGTPILGNTSSSGPSKSAQQQDVSPLLMEKNMKLTVAKQIALLVFAALIGIILSNGIGQYQMEKVFESANYGNVNSTPTMTLLDDIRKQYLRTRLQLNRHAVNTDKKVMAEIDETIKIHRKEMSDNLKKYVTTGCLGASCISDEHEKDLVKQLTAAWGVYEPMIDPILVESRANHKDNARDLLTKVITPAEAVAKHLDEIVEYNLNLSKKASAAAVTAKKSALIISLILTTLTLIVVGLIGWFITRNLRRQLGGEPVGG